MEYKMQIPPFPVKDFAELTAKQAKQIFEWYVGEIPSRLKQLQAYLDEETHGAVKLTKDIETLRPLWDWFSGTIKTRERSPEELQKDLENAPEWLHPTILEDSAKIAWESLSVGMDIAICFAEVMIEHNPRIHWDYFTKSKKRMSVNEPVLLGFKNGMDLNPRLVTNNLMLKHIRQKKDTGLSGLYDVWLTYIE